ncbi:hypothetical protein [Saccharothrix syringae]|uniref:Ricin B lectin domain-containing protein n=1 Tax=Saccharothrix syringae TaxID=103733 RepID=A0A5Q0GYL5_SACSY|nr:hypothetical protein [Saccharothrix syringae]QFZ18604.1 hypothetical protein EKG83_15055 [Saccharothrix syringae]
MLKKLLALTTGVAALTGALAVNAPSADALTTLVIKSELTSNCLADNGSDLLVQRRCSSGQFSVFVSAPDAFTWYATSTGTGKMRLRNHNGMCLDNDGWWPYFGNCVAGDSGQEWNITSCATTDAELVSNGKYLTAWPDGGLSMRGPDQNLGNPDSRQWRVSTSPWC